MLKPLLTLDPDADWTDCYAAAIARGPDAIAFLAESPPIAQAVSQDALDTLIHISLLRLLANPATAPPISVRCFETTHDLLHFDVRARGRALGTVVLTPGERPERWTDLFPADFDQRAAAEIDLEADRRAMRAWYLANRDRPSTWLTPRQLRPDAPALFALLSQRLSDRWMYDPTMGAMHVQHDASPRGAAQFRLVSATARPPSEALIDLPTEDYNLVRAACIRLGRSADPAIQRRLIDLVGGPHPTIRYNARFALRFSRDERIRDILRRYNDIAGQHAPINGVGVRSAGEYVAHLANAATCQ